MRFLTIYATDQPSFATMARRTPVEGMARSSYDVVTRATSAGESRDTGDGSGVGQASAGQQECRVGALVLDHGGPVVRGDGSVPDGDDEVLGCDVPPVMPTETPFVRAAAKRRYGVGVTDASRDTNRESVEEVSRIGQSMRRSARRSWCQPSCRAGTRRRSRAGGTGAGRAPTCSRCRRGSGCRP